MKTNENQPKIKKTTKIPPGIRTASLAVAALALMLGLGGPLSGARADEADAKNLLKAMSDYMAAQKVISFQFDTNLEIVTKDKQKLALASSGTVTLNRPDKIRATRTGGFADVELLFDGKTLTLLGKTANLYGQVEVPGTIDHLIDELRDKHGRPVPGADLLLSNVYDKLMPAVVNVKDLGSGVIGGVECDHLAFRTKEVDWQIWIAQGSVPIPAAMSSPARKLHRHRNTASRSRIGKPAPRSGPRILPSRMQRAPKRWI